MDKHLAPSRYRRVNETDGLPKVASDVLRPGIVNIYLQIFEIFRKRLFRPRSRHDNVRNPTTLQNLQILRRVYVPNEQALRNLRHIAKNPHSSSFHFEIKCGTHYTRGGL